MDNWWIIIKYVGCWSVVAGRFWGHCNNIFTLGSLLLSLRWILNNKLYPNAILIFSGKMDFYY